MQKTKKNKIEITTKATILSIAISASLVEVSAVAQETEQTEDELIEQITVTSSRRAVRLQDEGASVVAVDPVQFEALGVKEISGVIDYTPGVTFNSSGVKGTGSISARGVQQSLNIPVFGVYLDDTPVSSSSGFSGGSQVLFDGMLMDIDRVEIIKGPQGTLYGATSVGGMMRYISRSPELDEPRGSVGIDLSTTSEGGVSKVYNGKFSGPLIENKLGITLAAYKQDASGYIDEYDWATGSLSKEDINTANNIGLSIDVLYNITSNLSAKLKYLSQTTDYGLVTGDVLVESLTSDKGVYSDYGSVVRESDNTLEYEVSSLTLNYENSYGVFTSTSSLVDYSQSYYYDYTAIYGYYLDYLVGATYGIDVPYGSTDPVGLSTKSGSDKFVQEIKFTSEKIGNIEWLTGLYYAEEDTHSIESLGGTTVVESLDLSIPLDLVSANYPSNYKETAFFADATFYFNDKLDVTAGLRISDNETTLNADISGLFAGGDFDIDNQVVGDTVDTYLLSARYRPSKDMSIYGRIASGYRPVSTNLPIAGDDGENIAPLFIESDSLWSYELGIKGSLNDWGLSYDLATYYIDWDNFQTSLTVDNLTTGSNAEGGITAKGIDSMLVYRVNDSLRFTLSNAYTLSTLNEDEFGLGGIKGKQIPNTPKWTHALQVLYEFDLNSNWYASIGAGVRYTGGYETDWSYYQGTTIENGAKRIIDARTIADLNLTITNDQFTFGLYVNNLFNTRAMKTYTQAQNPLTGEYFHLGVFETPRTAGVRISMDF